MIPSLSSFTTSTNEADDDGMQSVSLSQSRSLTTQWDREEVAVIPIRDFDDAHTELREESKRLTKAISEIHKSGESIDQLGTLMMPTPNGAVVVIHPQSAKLTPVTKTRQLTLNGASVDIPEPLGTTIKKLDQHLEQLDVYPGQFPFGAVGTSPVVTTRLVPADGRHIVPWSTIDPLEAGSAKLLKELQNESFLYYCHTRHNPRDLPESYEFQVVVRIALFAPHHQITTLDGMQQVYEHGRPLYPVEAFEPLNLTSSWKLIDSELSVPPSFVGSNKVNFHRSSPLSDYRPTDPIITGHAEYEDLLGNLYDAHPAYDDLCEFTSIMAREADLAYFFGVAPIAPTGDPLEDTPGRTSITADMIRNNIDRSKTVSTDIVVKAPEDLEVLYKSRSTAQDGADDHWQSVKSLAITFRSKFGWDVSLVEQDGGSRPDLWVKTDGDEIFAVEVESTTQSKPANMYRNITRQALWGYKTIVVMVQQRNDKTGERQPPHITGEWGINKLAKPFTIESRTDQFCRVPNRSDPVTIEDTTLLLPEGMGEARWARTWEDELVLLPEGVSIEDGHFPEECEPLARGGATAPFGSYDFRLPRYRVRDDGTIVVCDVDGDLLTTYADSDDLDRTELYAPHRHVDLSYLHFVESLYCYNPDADTLSKYEISANWDTDKAERRHEQSHKDVFETFTLEVNGERLWEEEVRPFFRNWIGQLSTHGPPANNIFGEYRQPYTNRRGGNNNEAKFYDELTLRFSRGTVPPDQPGLETDPTYPIDWLDDEEEANEASQRLREPLIYELPDRQVVNCESESDDK